MKIHIAGAGIAGLASAYHLSKAGHDVTVYEKFEEIGDNPRGICCGEAHTLREEDGILPPNNTITKHHLSLELRYAKRLHRLIRTHWETVMLDRPKFLKYLLHLAEKEGAEIATNSDTTPPELSTKLLKADYIIDATGCPSVLKRTNFTNLFFGYQQTIENTNIYPTNLNINFLDTLGYIWLFPKHDRTRTVNVGVGVPADKAKTNPPKQILDDWIKKNKLEGEEIQHTAGYIPLGIQSPLIKNRTIFVGDTAIGCDELTGAGICRSLYNAKILPHLLENTSENHYKNLLTSEYPPVKSLPLVVKIWDFLPKRLKALLYTKQTGLLNHRVGATR